MGLRQPEPFSARLRAWPRRVGVRSQCPTFGRDSRLFPYDRGVLLRNLNDQFGAGNHIQLRKKRKVHAVFCENSRAFFRGQLMTTQTRRDFFWTPDFQAQTKLATTHRTGAD